MSFIDPSDTIFWNNESALYSLRAEINTLLDSKELNYLPGYDFYLDTALINYRMQKESTERFLAGINDMLDCFTINGLIRLGHFREDPLFCRPSEKEYSTGELICIRCQTELIQSYANILYNNLKCLRENGNRRDFNRFKDSIGGDSEIKSVYNGLIRNIGLLKGIKQTDPSDPFANLYSYLNFNEKDTFSWLESAMKGY